MFYDAIFADVFNFSCKKVNESIAVTHPRYSDPEDCQYCKMEFNQFIKLLVSSNPNLCIQVYVCINGDIPRRNGCKLGQVFNDKTKSCDWPRNVPEW